MRRVPVLVLVAAAAAALAAAAHAAPGARTFRVVERSQSFHYVDQPPLASGIAALSQGDAYVFSKLLLTPAGRRAGTLYGSCVAVVGGIVPVLQCTSTLGLGGGRIYTLGTVRGAELVEHVAIIGGTGTYEGARGSITSVRRSRNSRLWDDTVRLLP